MKAPVKPGSVTGVDAPATTTESDADDTDCCLVSGCSDVPLSKKCSRSASPISLASDRNPIHCNKATAPTRSLTQRAPTTGRPPSPTYQAPESHGASRDRRAPRGDRGTGPPEATPCGSTRKPARRGRPEGGPLPCGVGRCRPAGPDVLSGHPWSGGRWSA